MKPLFIVIEGMDGTGKTTITELLAEKLNAVLYKTPSLEFNCTRQKIDNGNNNYARFFYYLSATYYASTNIENIIENGKNVVCDRYYHTTFSAYDDEVMELLNQKKMIEKFYKPNFCFLLKVSEEERVKRLNSRNHLSKDDIESMKNKSLREKQIKKYENMNMIEIDTTKKTEEDVLTEILVFLKLD